MARAASLYVESLTGAAVHVSFRDMREAEVLLARPRSTVVVRRPAAQPERELPQGLTGRVDVDVADLDAAALLLGNHIRALESGSTLKASLLAKLQTLCGAVPTLERAKALKSACKAVASELRR
jgi:hypothetical protein